MKKPTKKERKVEKKRIEKNTRTRISRDNLSAFYAGIDWLEIKLIDGSKEVERIKQITEQTIQVEENGVMIEKTEKIPYRNLPGGLYIEYLGPVSGGISTVYTIKTSQGDQAGSIAIRNHGVKTNKNMPTRVELGGLFCNAYMRYLPFFCKFLGIDMKAGSRDDNGKRMKESPLLIVDYAIDILGGTVPMLHKLMRDKSQKIKMEGLGDTLTYTRIGNTRHKLKIYNKKLDIIENKKLKYKWSNGDSVYQHYLDEKQPIVRIECRKLSEGVKDLDDNSIEWVIANMQRLTCEYFKDYYEFEIGLLVKQKPIKKRIKSEQEIKGDYLIENLIQKKSSVALSRSKAYADSYTELKDEGIYFEKLYEKYGERIFEHMIKKHLEFPTVQAFDKAISILENKKFDKLSSGDRLLPEA